MGYNLLPFFLIIGSLAVIIVIVVRKFPQLSLLDVENLPEVKEEKKKNEYMKRRVQERSLRAHARISDWLSVGLLPRWKKTQAWFRELVQRVERQAAAMAREKEVKKPLKDKYKKKEEADALLAEARGDAARSDWEAAERKYIAVIRLDAKNADAYAGLGDVYASQGQSKEAKETLQFALQVRPNDEHAILKLAEIAEGEGNKDEAVRYYEQAVLLNDHVTPRFVKLAELLRDLGQFDTALEAIRQAAELEPQNPKYLDMLAEIAILAGNRAVAEAAYGALRLANPENQKLPAFRDKIDNMPSA